MATWLAEVAFPNGRTLYAAYSTVVESLLDDLYPECYRVGDVLPDGSRCYRAQPAGEPLPAGSGAASSIDDLTLVAIRCGPDDERWSALYCPNRRRVVGPLSWHHARDLQQSFELALDTEEVRHLVAPGEVSACCGHRADGPRLPFHIRHWFEMDEDAADEPARVDLYADWEAGTVCRSCLAGQLPSLVDAQ
jgi:hypothetical protein